MEVYVDDMLVKSKEEPAHLDDLKETFATLRQYQMKLNLSKCSPDSGRRQEIALNLLRQPSLPRGRVRLPKD